MAINYIPVFAAPITFDKTKSYKAHTIVMDGNYIYVSKEDVAANSTITDTTVWFKIAANNAVLNTLTTTANAAKTAASTAQDDCNNIKVALFSIPE